MKTKLEKPKTLRQLASRHWAEIERGTLLFDRQEREAAALAGADQARRGRLLQGEISHKGTLKARLPAAQ